MEGGSFEVGLFDVDGTMLDYLSYKESTARAAARVMSRCGVDSEEALRRRIFEVYDEHGWEQEKTLFHVLSAYGLPVGDAERIQQAALIEYNRTKLASLEPYPEVVDALAELKGLMRIAVVTDAPRNKAWQRLLLSGIEKPPPAEPVFEAVVTHDDTGMLKPDSEPFLLALRRLGWLDGPRPRKDFGKVLVVGDNARRDVLGGRRLGMTTCLALHGIPSRRDRRVRPHFEINRFKQILELPGVRR